MEGILHCKFAKCCNRKGHFYLYKNITKKYVYNSFKAEHCKHLYVQLARYILNMVSYLRVTYFISLPLVLGHVM